MARPADPHARRSLVTAARAEFSRKGLQGARIEDITQACALSKGAFYLHYASKEALFGEVVQSFTLELRRLVASRLARMKRFAREEGPLSAQDLQGRTPRYQALVAMEAEEDHHILELMWSYRDVMEVLISGSQGSAFDGLVWQIIGAEAKRAAQDFRQLQKAGAVRSDTPPELFGSLVVGAYLLVGKQMSQAKRKPDLASWALHLQRLIREGSSPLAQPSAPKRSKPRKRQ